VENPTVTNDNGTKKLNQRFTESGPIIAMSLLGAAVLVMIVLSVFSLSRSRGNNELLNHRHNEDDSNNMSQDLSPMSINESSVQQFSRSPESGVQGNVSCTSKASSTLFAFSPMAQSVSTRDSWEPDDEPQPKLFIPIGQDPFSPFPPRSNKNMSATEQFLFESEESSRPSEVLLESSTPQRMTPSRRFTTSPPSSYNKVRSPKRLSFDETICYAPKGPLGLIMDSSPAGPMVHSVKPFSPMAGILNPGDCIIAVDDEDTRHMDPASLAKLMMKKSKQEQRKLTVSQYRH
jgi:hypothetical protein